MLYRNKEWLVEQSINNKTFKQLENEYGFKSATLQKWAKIHNVKFKNSRRTNFFNEDFFESIDTEIKAYILGFIMADGYVDKALKVLVIKLKVDDLSHLENIRKALKSNIGIKYTQNKKYAKVEFCSKKLVNDLTTYGVVPNKTKTLPFPNIPSSLYKHFLRGYFDGDGHIGKKQSALVIGSEIFFQGFMDFLNESYDFKPWFVFNKTYYHIQFSKKDKWFIDWLYKGSNISLERKYKAYLEFWCDMPMEKV